MNTVHEISVSAMRGLWRLVCEKIILGWKMSRHLQGGGKAFG